MYRQDCKQDVREAYTDTFNNPVSASAAHNILLVYRVKENNRNFINKGWEDDGEHGAGRLVFEYLEDKGFVNITVVITKQLKGRIASVAKRSDLLNKIIEDACNQLTAVNKLPPP